MFKKFISKYDPNLLLFFGVIALVSVSIGLSFSVFSNYLKDAYLVNAYQRGFIEFPRELPGLLCLLMISALSFLGDIRLTIVALMLSAFGIVILGFITPTFAIMCIYVFIHSVGIHLYFPLSDHIGLKLIKDKSKTGKRLGQYGSVKTAFRVVAGLIVFFGFKYKLFSFTDNVKWVFVLSGLAAMLAVVVLLFLDARTTKTFSEKKKLSLKLDKDYKYYYILAILYGAQKQIVLVFGPWVLIDLLSKGADTISILNIISSLICVLFIPYIGKLIDKLGIKKMLYLDAISFILVYIFYGIMSGLFYNNALIGVGVPLFIAYGLYILDMMSESMGLIRVSYLKSIAKSQDDIMQTLSAGVSLDHVVSILCAYLGGIVWTQFGPQYVFFIAALFSFTNLLVAIKVKPVKH
jgi:hypothetical protein